ncbi:MAG: RNA polymerase sigma factor [Gemmatimonadota bacterium]
MRAVLGGEVEAYGILVRRYQDLLYRYVERMTGRPDDAADIVQAALVKGYRSLRLCRSPERVGAWLFRIAANACKDYLKSRRRRDVGLEEVPEPVSDLGQPASTLERRELAILIGRALLSLPVEQREAFVLKHVEGCSYEEMSELLGASIPALKMRVHRAREELRKLLEAYR